MKAIILAVACVMMVAPLAAEVMDSTANGFAVRNSAVIAALPSRVYNAAVDPGRWWNPAHTFSSNAANLTLQPRPGGCLCEGIANGGVAHLTVVFVAAQEEIRFTGALGPLQQAGIAGSMIWKLAESGAGTRFEWTYTVGGFIPGGLAVLAPAVDAVIAGQLQRLKRYVETGRPE